MSRNSIVFSSIKLSSSNNRLEKDEDGFYKVTLGALNTFNESGDFYLEDGVNDIIVNKSHTLARRLKAGYLKGEVGHPVYQSGMTKAQFYARNMRIDLNNTSHHIREIILTPTDKPSGLPGKGNMVLIEAWIKPSGPGGPALEKDLEDPNINVAFSIRCFTKDEVINGVNIKRILQIVTWDYVAEPGIKLANKFSKLSNEEISVESLEDIEIDISEISDNQDISECFNCSLESNDEKNITKELIDSYNRDNKRFDVLNKW